MIKNKILAYQNIAKSYYIKYGICIQRIYKYLLLNNEEFTINCSKKLVCIIKR